MVYRFTTRRKSAYERVAGMYPARHSSVGDLYTENRGGSAENSIVRSVSRPSDAGMPVEVRPRLDLHRGIKRQQGMTNEQHRGA